MTHDAAPAPVVRGRPTDGLQGFARVAVPLLAWWNTSAVTQRLVLGFTRQVSRRWILAAMSNRLEVLGAEHLASLAPSRGVLLVANHRTFWDMYVAAAVL